MKNIDKENLRMYRFEMYTPQVVGTVYRTINQILNPRGYWLFNDDSPGADFYIGGRLRHHLTLTRRKKSKRIDSFVLFTPFSRRTVKRLENKLVGYLKQRVYGSE